MTESLGATLEAFCSSAQHELVLVAPFIKEPVLRRLVGAVRPGVEATVITRWLPQDIASGVCDIGIWNVVTARSSSVLLVHSALHAKAYRADEAWLVGSANLTGAALGFAPRANLELLLPVPDLGPEMRAFEAVLRTGAVTVDEELAAATAAAAELLRLTAPSADPGPLMSGGWTPRLRQPADLLLAYAGEGDLLSRASREAADADLAELGVPPGLDLAGLRSYVAVALLRTAVVRRIDEFITVPRRFGEVRDFLARPDVLGDEPVERTWQALLRWLVYFLPTRYEYRRPRHSEVIVRVGSAPEPPAEPGA
ncbi:MAG TPA: phospholipase D family protein [Frankiaceae bacterium]|nr:phospholipase D family protein [Frankiaceae bacterium]